MAKSKAIHQPFEGRNPRGTFVKITKDMMESKAWKALSLRQRGLYLHLKSKYTQKAVDKGLIKSNIDDISLPESEWRELYGNYNTFRKDMDALEGYGFIKLVFFNWHTRRPNLYGFSDAWKNNDGIMAERAELARPIREKDKP